MGGAGGVWAATGAGRTGLARPETASAAQAPRSRRGTFRYFGLFVTSEHLSLRKGSAFGIEGPAAKPFGTSPSAESVAPTPTASQARRSCGRCSGPTADRAASDGGVLDVVVNERFAEVAVEPRDADRPLLLGDRRLTVEGLVPIVPLRIHGCLARFAVSGALDGCAGARPPFTASVKPRVWMAGDVTMDGRLVIGWFSRPPSSTLIALPFLLPFVIAGSSGVPTQNQDSRLTRDRDSRMKWAQAASRSRLAGGP